MQVLDWTLLDATARRAALTRPAQSAQPELIEQVRGLIDEVRRGGDAALLRLTQRFDGAALKTLRVSQEEFNAAEASLDATARVALDRAITNVRAFHSVGLPADVAMETEPGVHCERLNRAIQAVGLYVPAGSAPLPSSAIMLSVPAELAGCARRVLCTPPQPNGSANAAVLSVARRCGVHEIYKVGGAQAIAAMAYGTESIAKVHKIFGPGNAWVTAAKQSVAADPEGAALDMPAGPSEVMVIADDTARPEFIASDLLAQAEHDASAQAILLTDSPSLAAAVRSAVEQQWPERTRRTVLEQSLRALRLIVVRDLTEAVQLANNYAPEHLLIQTRTPRALLPAIATAGSVFLGEWTPEPMGDYCSGTNHVLPTYGYARAYSGLSVSDFLRRMTVQELTRQGLVNLGPTASALARLEGLDAHAHAVDLRLTALRAPGA